MSNALAVRLGITLGAKFMGKARLAEMLKTMVGSTFAGLDVRTEPRLKVGCPHRGNVSKYAKVSGQVGFDYENKVNNQREREGKESDFEAGENWHAPLLIDGKLTPLCYKKSDPTQLYLRMDEKTRSKALYLNNVTGEVVPEEEILPWLPAKSPNNQGIEKPVRFRTYSLDSIHAIRIGGEEYIMTA